MSLNGNKEISKKEKKDKINTRQQKEKILWWLQLGKGTNFIEIITRKQISQDRLRFG